MKKSFFRVALLNVIIILLLIGWFVLQGGITRLGIGFMLFVASILNLFVGLVLSIKKHEPGNYYGQSFLLFAAISILCSFTLCTIY